MAKASARYVYMIDVETVEWVTCIRSQSEAAFFEDDDDDRDDGAADGRGRMISGGKGSGGSTFKVPKFAEEYIDPAKMYTNRGLSP